MTTFGDMVYQFNGVPVGGSPILYNGGRSVFLDPAGGLAGNDAKSPASATQTFSVAKNLLTTDHNDVLYILGGSTAVNTAVALTWDLNYGHVIGCAAGLGIGNRCRIVGTTVGAVGTLLTISGSGNTFRNIQFYNGSNAAASTGAVTVSGSRNYFESCYFVGISGTTAGAQAGSFDLTVTGSENTFKNCAIGAQTAVRTAGYNLILTNASDNTFEDCKFRMASDTAGAYSVYYSNTTSSYDTYFTRCTFSNSSVNAATSITNAFNISTASDTYRLIMDNSNLVGFSGWGGDNAKQMYITNAAPTASSSGIAVKANS